MMSLLKGRLFREGAWVALGQVAAALAAIASIRVMTDLLSPAQFGRLTLLVAISALALSLTSTPFLQAVFRFYPDLLRDGRLGTLRQVSSQLITKLSGLAVLLISIGGIIFGVALHEVWWAGCVLALLLVIDATRSFELVFLNAARRQKQASFLLMSDAWVRPLAAALAIHVIGPNAENGLIGYALGAGLVVLAMKAGFPADRDEKQAAVQPDDKQVLAASIKTYSLPLMPLAIFGWLSGMGDRYVIAGVLSVSDVGMYAAAYGLASRPFLMSSGIIEQTYRPVLHAAVATNDRCHIDEIKRRILGVTAAVAIAGSACFFILSNGVATIFLAEEYRSAADLMPWIALGYGFQMVSSVYTRFCYVFDATKSVLALTSAGSVIGLLVLIPAAARFGLAGAAAAVPLRFFIELSVAKWLSRRAEDGYFSRRTGVSHAA